MVADMQQWGSGEVPSIKLRTIIDTLHYVQFNASFGVQMAELVAYIFQRPQRNSEKHPDAELRLLDYATRSRSDSDTAGAMASTEKTGCNWDTRTTEEYSNPAARHSTSSDA